MCGLEDGGQKDQHSNPGPVTLSEPVDLVLLLKAECVESQPSLGFILPCVWHWLCRNGLAQVEICLQRVPVPQCISYPPTLSGMPVNIINLTGSRIT